MEAKRISFISKSDDCWEQLAEEFQNLDLDSFVARAKIIAPHTFYNEPWTEEIEGEIQSESENFIVTWELFCSRIGFREQSNIVSLINFKRL